MNEPAPETKADPAALDDQIQIAARELREVLVQALLHAYDEAGMSGLCEEGRFEAAVGALREADIETLLRSRLDVHPSDPRRSNR